MPDCGSQVILCDLPVRMDTYRGCSHNCKYCFTYRKYDISNITVYESLDSLRNFLTGKRSATVSWCDWNIPIHIGGLSDPFQPVEKIRKNTLNCLKLLSLYNYPFVISTKSILAATDEYFNVLKNCDFVYQVSMLCSEYDKLETGAPTYEERLQSLKKMSTIAKRVVVRLQPYMPEYHNQILANLSRLKENGVYGIVIEALKMHKRMPGLVKIGADYCYPLDILKPKFLEIKAECRMLGLTFLCGENRLRYLGDSLTCCGTDGLLNYRHNTANLNHFIFDRENYKFTEKMNEKGTAMPFKAMLQNAGTHRILRKHSYKDFMQFCENDKEKLKVFIGESLG